MIAQPPTVPNAAAAAAPAKPAELPKAIPEDIKQVIASWNGIVSNLTGLTKTYLRKAIKSLGPDDSLLLVFDDANAFSYVDENRSGCKDALKAAVAERLEKEIEILVKLNDTGQPGEEIYPDLGQLIQMDIEEEDF